jgi:hypothetical protein
MKESVGAIVAAVVASACCIGPVAFAAIGSGALAASTKLATVRLPFLVLPTARGRADWFCADASRLGDGCLHAESDRHDMWRL